MPLLDTSQIPGYAEAVARQDLVRDAAFLGVPETLCGLVVSPLTFRHLLWLQTIQSPFIGCRPPDLKTMAVDVAAFFKTLAPLSHPSYMSHLSPADLEDLKTFMAKVGRLKGPVALKAIREFVDESFLDAPGGGDGSAASYYSIGAALTHRLCAHYAGLDPNPMNYPAAVDIPLKAGFQLIKCLRREENPKAILFNGFSDRAKGRWLNTLNPISPISPISPN